MIYITFINIRADENSELDEDGQGKMNLFKESKNKNKIKIKKKSEKKNQDEFDMSICSIQDSEKLEKKGKNPSKKSKQSEISDEVSNEIGNKKKSNKRNETETMAISKQEDEPDKIKAVKKIGAKKKTITSKKSYIEEVEDIDENDKKSQKKGKKTTKGQVSSENEENHDVVLNKKKQSIIDPKTPVAKDNLLRKSRLEKLQSTVKKTVKKRPMTRRAAAQAAAAAATINVGEDVIKSNESVLNVKVLDALKKTNKFEFDEAKPSLTATNDSTKTPLVYKNKAISNFLSTANKIKVKSF